MRACAAPITRVSGRDHQPITKRFVNGLPGNFPVAAGLVRVCGAIIELDELNGRALYISRVNETISLNKEARALKLLREFTNWVSPRGQS
jgi:calcineurin-like phosphoesterase